MVDGGADDDVFIVDNLDGTLRNFDLRGFETILLQASDGPVRTVIDGALSDIGGTPDLVVAEGIITELIDLALGDVTLGAGDDTLILTDVVLDGSLSAGSGNDKISINGTVPYSTGDIDLGVGDDNIRISLPDLITSTAQYRLRGGEGDDVFEFVLSDDAANAKFFVLGDEGYDTLRFTNISGSVPFAGGGPIIFGDFERLELSAGASGGILALRRQNGLSDILVGEDVTLHLYDTTTIVANTILNGGSLTAFDSNFGSIVGSDVAEELFLSSTSRSGESSAASVALGGGDDIFSGGAGRVSGDVDLGEGDDQLVAGRTVIDGTVYGGDGDDVIGSVQAMAVDAGGGDDRIFTNGLTPVLAGGAGADIFFVMRDAFTADGTNTLITDFSAADTIDLSLAGPETLSIVSDAGISIVTATIGDDRAIIRIAGDIDRDNILTGQDRFAAIPDEAETNEETAIVIDVLANDISPLGGKLRVIDVATTLFGTAAITGDGRIAFDPGEVSYGAVRIEYVIADGFGRTTTGIASVTVASVNDAPIGVADVISGSEDTPIEFRPGLNDMDEDIQTVRFSAFTQGANGTVSAAGPDRPDVLIYTPNANFFGTDSFTYTPFDGSDDGDITTVSVTVAPINDAPTAVADSVTVEEGTDVVLNILANDSDIDGDSFFLKEIESPINGILTNMGGIITYDVDDEFVGTERIYYVIQDDVGAEQTGYISFTFTEAPDLIDEGSSGDDTIIGRNGDDILSGGGGNDIIRGGLGADTLSGGDGNDDLFGGQGNDLLTGGANADRFIGNFDDFSGDIISDFTFEDRIVVRDNRMGVSFEQRYDDGNIVLTLDSGNLYLEGSFGGSQLMASGGLTAETSFRLVDDFIDLSESTRVADRNETVSQMLTSCRAARPVVFRLRCNLPVRIMTIV